MTIQVHDEPLLDTSEAEADEVFALVQKMESVLQISIPIVAK